MVWNKDIHTAQVKFWLGVILHSVYWKGVSLESSLISRDTPKTAAIVLKPSKSLFHKCYTLWMYNYYNSNHMIHVEGADFLYCSTCCLLCLHVHLNKMKPPLKSVNSSSRIGKLIDRKLKHQCLVLIQKTFHNIGDSLNIYLLYELHKNWEYRRDHEGHNIIIEMLPLFSQW
jgi:hypothetical protein